jgi:uncharacterized protein YqjF (DUF2071 family)
MDLVFIHFEVDAAELLRFIPPGLTLELFQGKAWIGIVPFRMEGVSKRGWPAPSMLCDFPEINVRTYVTDGHKSGVWFLSLFAPHRIAVWVARSFFNLPYYFARVSITEKDRAFHYRMQRGERMFVADYKPGRFISTEAGSFSHWATERYCLYSVDRYGCLWRGEVQHAKWPLQEATVDIQINRIAPVTLGAMHPTVLFSSKLDVVLWSLAKV